MSVFQLDNSLWFPSKEHYEDHGIVAIGGDLSIDRLILAYHSGLFPWYNADEPILWWSPKERMVLRPGEQNVSKSLRNILNRKIFRITADTAFEQVIENCQKIPRPGQDGTWLGDDMKTAYLGLHKAGFAHSIECWQDDELVGGLYGVSLGNIFCGESMFSKVSNASKVAFVSLSKKLEELDFELIDCQVYNPFLSSLGAYEISRDDFLIAIGENDLKQTRRGSWRTYFEEPEIT